METFETLAALAIKQLAHGGAFLMTGKTEKNPMTIGWCQFGRVWNKSVCTVFVRHSRYSFGLLERDDVFTVCFPAEGALKKELGFCGVKSGRDVDKLKVLGLTTLENRSGSVDALQGCNIVFECRVLCKLDMCGHMDTLAQQVRDQFYVPEEQAGEDGDPHMVYYAEVLDAYRVD